MPTTFSAEALIQEERFRRLSTEKKALESNLRLLQAQVEPHFLFNTLNAISTLILDRDNDTANRAVTRLSDFLRYTLHNDPLKKVSLECGGKNPLIVCDDADLEGAVSRIHAKGTGGLPSDADEGLLEPAQQGGVQVLLAADQGLLDGRVRTALDGQQMLVAVVGMQGAHVGTALGAITTALSLIVPAQGLDVDTGSVAIRREFGAVGIVALAGIAMAYFLVLPLGLRFLTLRRLPGGFAMLLRGRAGQGG